MKNKSIIIIMYSVPRTVLGTWCIYTVSAVTVVMFGQNGPQRAALPSRTEPTARNAQVRCGQEGKGRKKGAWGLQDFLGSEGKHPKQPCPRS